MRDPRAIVREGYDRISYNYRSDRFDLENTGYERLLSELEPLLRAGDRVLDLGCGCGVPVARYLAEQGYRVVGVDISAVQVARAKELVPGGQFLCADMTGVQFPAGSFEAVVSFFAIIHVPLEEQFALFQRIHEWLVPGGHLLALAGHREWTGTEADWHGAEMYWSHADEDTYRQWLERLDFRLLSRRFLAEGTDGGGHTAFLARRNPR